MNLKYINAVDIAFGSSGFKMLIATMYDCHQVGLGCANMQDVCVHAFVRACVCVRVCLCVSVRVCVCTCRSFAYLHVRVSMHKHVVR